MANENRDWGYRRIWVALSTLGYCMRYGCQHPPEARDRADSRSGTQDDVEGVPEAPLGTDRRRRLLYHRSLDSPRPTALDRVIFHRVVHPESRDRRDFGKPE